MGKTLMDKKVNREAKALNRELTKDVFGTRFEVRQTIKTITDGIEYYKYRLIDNIHPERNLQIEKWLDGYEIISSHKLYQYMNDFIISSDFWENYRKQKD